MLLIQTILFHDQDIFLYTRSRGTMVLFRHNELEFIECFVIGLRDARPVVETLADILSSLSIFNDHYTMVGSKNIHLLPFQNIVLLLQGCKKWGRRRACDLFLFFPPLFKCLFSKPLVQMISQWHTHTHTHTHTQSHSHVPVLL